MTPLTPLFTAFGPCLANHDEAVHHVEIGLNLRRMTRSVNTDFMAGHFEGFRAARLQASRLGDADGYDQQGEMNEG
jgi:hypothetical protein